MKITLVQSSRRFYGDTDYAMSLEAWRKDMIENWADILEHDAVDPVPSVSCYEDGSPTVPIQLLNVGH